MPSSDLEIPMTLRTRTARTSRAIVATAVAGLAASTVPTTTAEAAGNMFGGRVVEDTQLYFTAGFPDVEFGAQIPMSTKFEIRPKLKFAYGEGTGVGLLNLSPGAGFRIQLLESGDLTGALTLQANLNLLFGGFGGFGVGVGLGYPGFEMSYAVIPELDIDFGIRFEDDLYFTQGGVWFLGSVPFIVGVEGRPTDDIAVGFKLEAGPGFTAGNAFGFGGFGGLAYADIRAVVGVAFVL